MKSPHLNKYIRVAIVAGVWPLTTVANPQVAIAASSDTKTPATEALSLQSLPALYEERIAKLEIEIRKKSEQRTVLIDQIDQHINAISALEDESLNAVKSSTPVTDSVTQINREVETLEKELLQTDTLLKKLQNSVASQPELSIWKAALGTPDTKTHQHLLATQSYLMHTAVKHQTQLQDKRALLEKRQLSLIKYQQDIDKSIGERQSHIDTLLEQREKLEQQLVEISAQIVSGQDRISSLTRKSQQSLSTAHFSKHGKPLRDPVEGTVIKRFSEPKAKGLLKWQGVLVEAPLGLPFTSVSDGLVVFADQLQGLGNVAIIDHGQGYMTLYGMAELLVVEKDQLVLAGDPVGTVGKSVGTDASALYFEVRHNAEALDPQDWLEMRQIAEKGTR